MPRVPLSRILVPTDFSACASAALRSARRLADRDRAEVLLLHVLDRPLYRLPDSAPLPVTRGELIRHARRRLMRTAWESLPGLRVRGVLADGPAAEAIARHAELGDVDLIVIGTHGWSGARPDDIGRVTERVIRIAPCPVLTVPPRPAPGGERRAARRRRTPRTRPELVGAETS